MTGIAPRLGVSANKNVSRADQPAAEMELVMDCLGGMLQAYGQYAFDTSLRTGDEVRGLVQNWRMHALVGATHPSPTHASSGGAISDRDWHGLVRFFADARRDETSFVVRGQRNLRDSIWAFVSALHHLVVEEHEDSKVAQEQIHRVKAAAGGHDTELLKTEAVAAVTALEALMSSRRTRQQQQYSALAERLSGMGRELEDARRESCIDMLTGLPNRKDFDDCAQKTIELQAMTGQPACLMMVDVDAFKTINDTHGHPLGDEALRQVARALSRTVLRKVDFVCRYGGDEFAIILHETDGPGGLGLGNKLRSALRDILDTPRANEQDLDYTLSIGVAELRLGDDVAEWTSRADQALYQAKKGGRNQVALIGRDEASADQVRGGVNA